MERLLLALVIVAVAAVVAEVVRRRRRLDPPTQRRAELPAQLDRADFVRPEARWLVVVFSSTTCSTCADVVRKSAVLESGEVAVQDVPFETDRDLHARYGVESVPALVIAGPDGAVRFAALGPITATDLWAAVAEAREPGSVRPEGGDCERHRAD